MDRSAPFFTFYELVSFERNTLLQGRLSKICTHEGVILLVLKKVNDIFYHEKQITGY